MKQKIIIIGILSLLFSCSSYTISVGSFREQMVHANTENLKEVEINDPTNSHHNIGYLANGIKSIIVIDKDGKEIILENSPKLEMRITQKSGKKSILYFDTAIIENDTLKGTKSRYFQNLKQEIPMNDIKKIEIQNGGKNFKYQEK